MSKITVATNWLESCAGCHMSLLDIDERIVEFLNTFRLTSSPITDLKHPPAGGVDVGILTGGVGNQAEEEDAEEMRDKARILIAMGDCAVTGGICTMRNSYRPEEVLQRGYVDTESTVDGAPPHHPDLTPLTRRVRSVGEVVPVDVHLPGCPPSADAIWFVLTELAAGRTPVLTGAVLRYGLDSE